jgi:hypothetical protein
MQEITIEAQAKAEQERVFAPASLLDLPIAKLQIVQATDILTEDWLDRSMLEPKLARNADGLWVLTVRRQGEHSKFEVPYVGSEMILADAELGLIVVLIGYHGAYTEKYGRLGYMTQKGQFYRYYRQESTGDWQCIAWRTLNDDLRQLIISTVQEHGPAWAKSPGKLQSERKPPAKPVTMTSYKVVRVIDGRYFSLYDPSVEYVIGERLKQPAKPKHGGGFYSFPTLEMGTEFLTTCTDFLPFHSDVVTPQVALLECEIGGRIINYGHKMASTYLCPIRVLEVRAVSTSCLEA